MIQAKPVLESDYMSLFPIKFSICLISETWPCCMHHVSVGSLSANSTNHDSKILK